MESQVWNGTESNEWYTQASTSSVLLFYVVTRASGWRYYIIYKSNLFRFRLRDSIQVQCESRRAAFALPLLSAFCLALPCRVSDRFHGVTRADTTGSDAIHSVRPEPIGGSRPGHAPRQRMHIWCRRELCCGRQRPDATAPEMRLINFSRNHYCGDNNVLNIVAPVQPCRRLAVVAMVA